MALAPALRRIKALPGSYRIPAPSLALIRHGLWYHTNKPTSWFIRMIGKMEARRGVADLAPVPRGPTGDIPTDERGEPLYGNQRQYAHARSIN
ncbi:MAG: hypothetical protein M1493_15740 [Firmicutes bacterium]|nr:hypothetical protein [Bacillota bacterium]